jgi:uncharacterized protein
MEYFNCPFEIKQENITEQGIFTGYGSTFGGKPDSYGDIVEQGAFTDSLKKGGRNGSGIAMLWQHNPDQPIGVYQQVIEDSKGLQVVGKLALEVQQGKEAYVLMRMGALNGLSIGWDFQRDEKGNRLDGSWIEEEKNGIRIRTLKKIELWEISPVTFPANINATINNVKVNAEGIERAYIEAKNIRELENMLRDAGISKKGSEIIASKSKFALERDWKKYSYEILNAIKQIRKEIQ